MWRLGVFNPFFGSKSPSFTGSCDHKNTQAWHQRNLKLGSKLEYFTILILSYVIQVRQKKYSCFGKCGWREKFSPGRPHIYFFKQFSGDILFSTLVSFTFSCFDFFLFCLFCLFVFWNQKYIFWYTFNYARGWVINVSPVRLPEDYFFLAWFSRTKMSQN